MTRGALLNLAVAFCAAAASAASATPATAASELALAQSKHCLNCHAIDRKIVGPAYRDVAAKFAGQSGAVDLLASKIMHGSSGTWDTVPMPPNTDVTEAEARRLATWILSLK